MGVNTVLNMNLPWGTESEDLQLIIKSLISYNLPRRNEYHYAPKLVGTWYTKP